MKIIKHVARRYSYASIYLHVSYLTEQIEL